MKNKRIKTILVLSVVICFFIIPINQSLAITSPLNSLDSKCYGFIVSYILHQNATIEYLINRKIPHMINDLFREEIPIYWTAENKTINVKKIENGEISAVNYDLFFERGSFIIPFLEDDTQDSKIAAIIYDYNESSEIEDNYNLTTPVYLIVEPVDTEAYLLTEVKAANIVSDITTCEFFYTYLADECGFLSFDYIGSRYIGNKLDNSNYNLVIWPGGIPTYLGSLMLLGLKTEIKLKSTSQTIRKFVSNGGGFVGSCYAAYEAAFWAIPAPLILLRRAYNSELRSFVFFAISDVIVRISLTVGPVTLRITNDSHPVNYGIDQYFFTEFHGGPKFIWLGKNSQGIARYHNSGIGLGNSPSWVISKFDKGRVVLFASHPEFGAYNSSGHDIRTKILSNAFYYATNKGKSDFQTSLSRDFSYILNVWEKTEDLSENLNNPKSVLDEVKLKINKSIDVLRTMFIDLNYSVQYYYFQRISKILNNIERVYLLVPLPCHK